MQQATLDGIPPLSHENSSILRSDAVFTVSPSNVNVEQRPSVPSDNMAQLQSFSRLSGTLLAGSLLGMFPKILAFLCLPELVNLDCSYSVLT